MPSKRYSATLNSPMGPTPRSSGISASLTNKYRKTTVPDDAGQPDLQRRANAAEQQPQRDIDHGGEREAEHRQAEAIGEHQHDAEPHPGPAGDLRRCGPGTLARHCIGARSRSRRTCATRCTAQASAKSITPYSMIVGQVVGPAMPRAIAAASSGRSVMKRVSTAAATAKASGGATGRQETGRRAHLKVAR